MIYLLIARQYMYHKDPHAVDGEDAVDFKVALRFHRRALSVLDPSTATVPEELELYSVVLPDLCCQLGDQFLVRHNLSA